MSSAATQSPWLHSHLKVSTSPGHLCRVDLPAGYSQSISIPLHVSIISIRNQNHSKFTIKSQIQNQLGRRLGKLGPTSISAHRLGELVPISPPADRQEGLHLPVLFLQQVKLLDAAVDIVARVVPRVTGVVLFDIGPGVGQVPV